MRATAHTFFIVLFIVTASAWAAEPCSSLLLRTQKLLQLENAKAEKYVLINNDILKGRGSIKTLWRPRNPWRQYDGQRVMVVFPIATTANVEARFSAQSVMKYDTFRKYIPELDNEILDILRLSKLSGHEWGFQVYILRDPSGQLHIVVNRDKITSRLANSIKSLDIIEGMNQAAGLAQALVQRHTRIQEGATNAKWEVVEAWLVHTHPDVYSPLSQGDILCAQSSFDFFYNKSLRFRMMAVTTNDPTVFSISHEPSASAKYRYYIAAEDGWGFDILQNDLAAANR